MPLGIKIRLGRADYTTRVKKIESPIMSYPLFVQSSGGKSTACVGKGAKFHVRGALLVIMVKRRGRLFRQGNHHHKKPTVAETVL